MKTSRRFVSSSRNNSGGGEVCRENLALGRSIYPVLSSVEHWAELAAHCRMHLLILASTFICCHISSLCVFDCYTFQPGPCTEWLSKPYFFEVFFLFLFHMLSNLAPSKIWRLVFKGNMFWKSVGNLPWPDTAPAIFVHVWMNAWDNETSGYAVILQWCGPAKLIPV